MSARERQAEALIAERELQLEALAIADFMETLGREQRALAEHRADAVGELSAEKAERLAVLSRFAAQRVNQLRAAGHKADAEGMRAWLASHPDSPGLAQEWARVTGLARRAREQNDINGWLISLNMQRTQRQLAFLNKAASNEPVYAADGIARSAVQRRSLGEA